MGKRIRAQKIGRGSPPFKASVRRKFRLSYPSQTIRSKELLVGNITALSHDPGRGSPVAEVRTEDGRVFATSAVQGVAVGQTIHMGSQASVQNANIVPLDRVPEGTTVSSIELKPGDGGKLARSSGSFATVVAHVGDKTVLSLPSKRTVQVSSKSLAIVGTVAAAGRTDKPFLKAGSKHHFKAAKGRKYPTVKGVSMHVTMHPFGGGSHRKIGRPTTVSRRAPPGRKVGLIAARRTGRGGRRQRKR